MASTRKDDSVPFLPLSYTRPSVKIYKCPRCVKIFTRKGLGVHFTKIHRLILEDVYLDEEIDEAEVKVEKSMTEGGPIIDISFKRPSCELGKNNERVDFHAENKKTHKCSKCHREFYKEKSLKQHVTLMHSETKFDCAYCQAKFKLESVMQRHQKICTKKIWKSKLESVIHIHQKKCSTKSGGDTTFSANNTVRKLNEKSEIEEPNITLVKKMEEQGLKSKKYMLNTNKKKVDLIMNESTKDMEGNEEDIDNSILSEKPRVELPQTITPITKTIKEYHCNICHIRGERRFLDFHLKSDMHKLAEKKIQNDKKENRCINNSAQEIKGAAESINATKNEDENIKDFENVQTNQDFSCFLDITIKEEPIESVDIKNEPFLPYDNGIKIEVEEENSFEGASF